MQLDELVHSLHTGVGTSGVRLLCQVFLLLKGIQGSLGEVAAASILFTCMLAVVPSLQAVRGCAPYYTHGSDRSLDVLCDDR